MFGTLRFLLALAVLFSHTFPFPYLNVGVSAVVVFYIISGYVMTGLLDRHYGRLSEAPGFYLDRAMRIYPQYLFILCLTWVGWAGGLLRLPETHVPLSWVKAISNILLIPLNYFMYASPHSWGVAYIPPAWSLGAELQFYLLFPFVLLLRQRLLATVVSLLIFTIASLQYLPTNTHSFRLLDGALFMFLLGSLLYDGQKKEAKLKQVAMVIYGYCLLLGVGLLITGRLSFAQNSHSIFIGIALGYPIFAYLSTLPRQTWDERLGDLSYGLFLSHFVIIWLLERWAFFRVGRESYPELWKVIAVLLLKLALTTIGALVLSYLGFRFVEKPVLTYRKNIRKKQQAAEGA